MRTRILSYLFWLSILATTLSGCGEDGEGFTGFGPEVEWISGGTSITYVYAHGAIAGYNFIRSIDVVKGSGEIEINFFIKGNSENKKTVNFSVEKGKQYKFSLRGGIDGRNTSNPNDQCMTVVFSSPNCRKDYEINVDSYVVMGSNEWVSDMYYCPENLILSEIIITAL